MPGHQALFQTDAPPARASRNRITIRQRRADSRGHYPGSPSKRSVRSTSPSMRSYERCRPSITPRRRAHNRGAASGLIRGGIPGDRGRGSPGSTPPNRETRASLLADFAMWRVVMLNHNRPPHNTDAPDVVADIRGHVCTPGLKGFRQKARHSAARKGACLRHALVRAANSIFHQGWK